MRVRRAGTGVVLGALALVLSVTSMAWACTAQVNVMGPLSGAPGSEVTVKGGAAPANGQVFILWNALDGQRLATADTNGAGDFSATVTVPEVAPGVYFMVIAGEDRSEGVARMAFEVTPAAGAQPILQPVAELATAGANQSSDAGLAAGAVLLAVGLVALFSGITVAAVRRTRTSATSSSI